MARVRRPEPSTEGEVPEELQSRLHPIWGDVDEVRARFPEHVPRVVSDIGGRRLHGTVLRSWAIANGFVSTKWPGHLDWHRLRSAALHAQSLARAGERVRATPAERNP
jgi:hypothetical protein